MKIRNRGENQLEAVLHWKAIILPFDIFYEHLKPIFSKPQSYLACKLAEVFQKFLHFKVHCIHFDNRRDKNYQQTLEMMQ